MMKDDLQKKKISDESINSSTYKQFEKAYQYAIDMTLRETRQAVEGMYHNLNTLQLTSLAA